MRTLFITRGIPGCGKSTFLRECGLDAYAIEPDAIRLLVCAPELQKDGRVGISQENDKKVWSMVAEALETRMARGELVVVDATHVNNRTYHDYEALCKKYRYDNYVIDFSHVPLTTCHKQNNQRQSHKFVPAEVLDTMHKRLTSSTPPKSWNILTTTDEVNEVLASKPLDFSHYNAIHHIGDIQGCIAPLERYFAETPYNKDDAYIFTGDLLDRGPENAKVLAYILEHFVARDNVYAVEGNHDSYIWQWLTNQPIRSREFTGKTQPQLEAANLDKRQIHQLVHRMRPYVHYTFDDKEVLVTHGGLSAIPQHINLLSAKQCIRGVGKYEDSDEIDALFASRAADHQYQIHGHRNKSHAPTKVNNHCYNLEGEVEFGGELRTLTLSHNSGFVERGISSPETACVKHPENAQFVCSLRENPYIRESTLPGMISSFNFTHEAFRKAKWSNMTVKARGLFVNTLSNEIVIRSYDKFFNIGEMRHTEYQNLEQSLTFPVTAWVKENGYLGLLGYDSLTDQLLFASKSTTESEFATWFRELFERRHGKHIDTIKAFLREHNATLIFEVVLPKKDPHIIQYPHDSLVLLDAVARTQEFSKINDDEVQKLARLTNLAIKTKAATLHDWAEFEAWYAGIAGMEYRLNDRRIEGFVLEDARGQMVKTKLEYYTFWKQIRTQLERAGAGKTPVVPKHTTQTTLATTIIDELANTPTTELPTLFELQDKYLQH